MTAREPQEMAEVAAETGAKKTHRTWDRVLVSSFLAGAYISFGGLVAITVAPDWIPRRGARCRRCSWARRSPSASCWSSSPGRTWPPAT